MDQDPSLWAALCAWAVQHAAQLNAFWLSVATAILRVAYTKGRWQQMCLEGALCGLGTLTLVPLLTYFSMPESMATFIGGMVGFLGVEKFREYADKVVGKKVDQA